MPGRGDGLQGSRERIMGHYLLTGVAGFIASKLAELLLADSHTVVGVDNLNDAYDVCLNPWKIPGSTSRPMSPKKEEDKL